MNTTFNFLKASLFLLVALFIVGCEDDTPGGGTLNDPEVILGSSSELTVSQGEEFIISVSATANGADLETIRITEDGTNVNFSRIAFDGVAANSNPVLILDDSDKAGFSYDIGITAHETVGTVDYAVIVEDVDGNSASVTVSVTTTGEPPSISIAGSGSIEVDPNGLIIYNVAGNAGTSTLESIALYENGELIDITRMGFDGEPVANNPHLLDESNQNGFASEVEFRANNVPGTYELVIVLTDAAGLTAEDATSVIVSPAGTAIETFDSFVLVYNANSPNPTGGLDLDAASADMATVSVNSSAAEIVDMGIDSDLPDASNWIQKIRSVNGANLRYIEPGQNGIPENFDFSDITIKEDLPDLYNNGVDTEDNISNVVNVGDIFIIEKDGTYYAVLVVEVTPTTNNNLDSYTFDIKR